MGLCLVDERGNFSQAIIVMGVAGAGKTTVGQALAAALDWPFYDGDDFHPRPTWPKWGPACP